MPGSPRTSQCEACKTKEDSLGHCIKCDKKFCSECKDEHEDVNAKREHFIINEDLLHFKTDSIGISSRRLCSKHKENVAFFCEECNKGQLCFRCIWEHHSEHPKAVTTTYNKELHQTVRTKKAELNRELKSVTEFNKLHRKHYDAQLGSDMNLKKALESLIERRYNTMLKEVERTKQTLLEQVARLTITPEQQQQQIDGKCEQNNNKLTNVQNDLHESTDKSTDDPKEKLTFLESRIKTVQACKHTFPEARPALYRFCPGEGDMNLLFGYIDEQ